MSEQPGISVIICCYNSELRIEATLIHIQRQIVQENILWEVILVNNNSTDNTTGKAKEVWNSLNSIIPFTIVNEETTGLSNARIKGVANASYEYLLFCDDDNWLQNNYLQRAYDIMEADKSIGILGGQSDGHFEIQKPHWFDNFEAAYAVGKPLPQSGNADKRRFLAGAGMITRKSIFRKLESASFKQLLSDRTGSELNSGGDTELCLAVLFMGHSLYYDERLRFTHYISAKRLQWKYCVTMCANHAKPQIYFYLYQYAHENILAGVECSFEKAYKSFVIKHGKSLLRNCSSLSGFLKTILCLLFSNEGSLLEVDTKKKISKIVFALRYKKKINADFTIICHQVEKITALNKSNNLIAQG